MSMRQRSASYQDEDSLSHQPDPIVRRSSPSGQFRTQTGVSPRISLPQHRAIVDAALPEDIDEKALVVRKPKRSPKPSSATQALTVHTSATSPIVAPEPATPADLQLIPRTLPAVPNVKIKQSWFHKSSPRFTLIKILLIVGVTVSVLTATLATAGGGAVTTFFKALESVIPYSAPAQPAAATTVAQRVKPIIQADENAGYDSQAQHDTWWNAACSAAAMTEILHAWGITDVTIGRLIDIMYAHNPPYITPYGGLMTPDAWNYMMSNYHMHATVYTNHTFTYEDMVKITEVQGIPVVLNVRDSAQAYYPAFNVGHFLVVVGGDSAGLKIVDSSLYRIQYLPRNEVDALWTGLNVVITKA
jgi:hypothetical protein